MIELTSLYIIILIVNLFFFKNLNYISKKINIYDKPSSIKVHKKAVPPIGGIFLFINIIVSLTYISCVDFKILETYFYIYGHKQFIVFILTVTVVFFIGLFDDKYNLSANQKLLFLIPIILFIIFIDDGLKISKISLSFIDFQFDLNRTATIFSLICFLTYLNCINMFDGINLQTSLFAITLILSIQFYFNIFSPLLIVIILFLIFFSIYNYQNKIFIGDSGTLLIAFLIAYIFIKMHNYEKINSDIIFSFTILPFIDMVRLIFKRLIKGKNPFNGDRDHIHHRLLKKRNMKDVIIIIFLSYGFPIFLNILTEFKYNLTIIILSILVYIFLLLNSSDKKNNIFSNP